MSNISVDIDFSGVENKFSDRNIQRGRYALANQMMSDMEEFVPRQEGDLRTAVSMSLDASEIHYHMQYAQKQFTTQFSNYTVPGTGPRWDLKAKSIYMSTWVRVFAKGADF